MLIRESQVQTLLHPVAPQEIVEGRYVVKLAETRAEMFSALRLRYDVFKVELLQDPAACDEPRIDIDEFDLKCRHLIVVDSKTSRTVGTYRLNTIEAAGGPKGFYSSGEFKLDELPSAVLADGVETGRACIAPEHRNSKVLFLLWRGLASFLRSTGKRYFFGCCSIFARDESVGASAYRQLLDDGHVHDMLRVSPLKNPIDLAIHGGGPVELPSLFNMYLRIGAKVCGPPTVDHDFGTIDFFVVCDADEISGKYRRMFFS